MPRWAVVLAAFCCAGAPLGCAKLDTARKPTLPRAQMSSDSVVLDIFFVRVPMGDPLANDVLWAEVDEQQLPADLRMRLADNGIRVGVLGNQIPPSLERLVAEAPVKKAEDPNAVERFDAEPKVMQRHLQSRTGVPGEIIARNTPENFAMLETLDGQLGGQTYAKAQGVFQVKTFPQPDGQVRVELAPELHHDEPKIEYVDHGGAWMHDVRRPRRLFPELKIEATLSAGEMIVLTSLPEHAGSLGHHCFAETTSRGVTQKLLIVRLSQTQHVGEMQ
jgi:hypothetical protein